MKIEIDEKSGFCFGVVKAISMAEKVIQQGQRVFSLGDIVHNRVEVQRLEELGLRTISHEQFASVRGNTVLIRAHGEPPATYRLAQEVGVEVVDATCPVVAHLQKLVVEAYRQMQQVGGQVVILGKRGHAEVVGLTGQVEEQALVVEEEQDIEKIDFTRPIYLLSQTTQSLALFEQIQSLILGRVADPSLLIVNDTICRQVSNRTPHLREFAQRFDVVIFVSGRKSSNGGVLFKSCQEGNRRSYNIEDEHELDSSWFEGCLSVGVCGATSTPKWLMQRVADAIAELVVPDTATADHSL